MIKNTSRHVSHEYEILCTHTRHKNNHNSKAILRWFEWWQNVG